MPKTNQKTVSAAPRREYHNLRMLLALALGLIVGAIFFARGPSVMGPDTRTCTAIENVMLQNIVPIDTTAPVYISDLINNVRVYVDLAYYGCPENTETFQELAVHYAQIARAMQRPAPGARALISPQEAERRAKIQAEFDRAMGKVQQLTAPAIDFFLQIENIFRDR